jgi:serine O-acetyltransferase
MASIANPEPRPDSLRYVGWCLNADIVRLNRYASDFSGGRITWVRRVSFLLTPPILCVALYRLSHWLYLKRWRWAARWLALLNYAVHKAAIAPAAGIGPGLYIPHTVGVVFYGHAGRNLTLYARAVVTSARIRDWLGPISEDSPRLGDGITLGVGAVTAGGISIGSRTKIGARIPVLESLAAGSLRLQPEDRR